MPQRIQRKRTAGWRMPEGAIYVGRPTKWGNPFGPGMLQEVRMCGVKIRDGESCHPSGDWAFRTLAISLDTALTMYRDALSPIDGGYWPNPLDVTIADAVRELRGRDLACWCPLDQPCHADVLLEVANR